MSIGFGGLLTILFIALKLTGVIAWSWWWVWSPMWIIALFWFALFGGIAFIGACFELRTSVARRRYRNSKRF